MDGQAENIMPLALCSGRGIKSRNLELMSPLLRKSHDLSGYLTYKCVLVNMEHDILISFIFYRAVYVKEKEK